MKPSLTKTAVVNGVILPKRHPGHTGWQHCTPVGPIVPVLIPGNWGRRIVRQDFSDGFSKPARCTRSSGGCEAQGQSDVNREDDGDGNRGDVAGHGGENQDNGRQFISTMDLSNRRTATMILVSAISCVCHSLQEWHICHVPWSWWPGNLPFLTPRGCFPYASNSLEKRAQKRPK